MGIKQTQIKKLEQQVQHFIQHNFKINENLTSWAFCTTEIIKLYWYV